MEVSLQNLIYSGSVLEDSSLVQDSLIENCTLYLTADLLGGKKKEKKKSLHYEKKTNINTNQLSCIH